MAATPFNFRWTTTDHDKACETTFLQVNWDHILDESRRLSGHATCVYQGGYHAGGRHIVRRIELRQHDELWLVRIPKLQARSGAAWTPEAQFVMESEIATMKYIAQSTSIPVPKVFAYSCITENPAGAPYLLMQCIKGNMLYDMGGRPALDEQQKLRMRKSIAWIQCELAGAPLRRLGCLTLKPDGGIDVGHLPASFGFEGPFDSVAEYFFAWCKHNKAFKNLHRLTNPSVILSAKRFPERLASVIKSLLPPNNVDSCYPIIHPDLEVHNLLFDDNYEIVGVIDWEFAFSAPIEVFASRTNIYAQLDTDNLTQAWNEEGKQYLADVEAIEKVMAVSLSTKFGSLLGDLGICMCLFEEGRAGNFDVLLDRAEASSLDA